MPAKGEQLKVSVARAQCAPGYEDYGATVTVSATNVTPVV